MRLSYSAWKTHDQCPRKYKHSYIDKLPRRPPGNAVNRGLEVHDSIDKYFQRKGEEVHPEVRNHYGQWFMQMREYDFTPELKFGVDENWEPAEFNDPKAAWRGLIDLAENLAKGETEMDWYEWKTGKIYQDHAYQSNLYGTIALTCNPEVKLVRIHNVYFDQKKTETREYKREDLEGLQFLWDKRRSLIMNDEYYGPNPGWYCRYCDYGKEANGPCQF